MSLPSIVQNAPTTREEWRKYRHNYMWQTYRKPPGDDNPPGDNLAPNGGFVPVEGPLGAWEPYLFSPQGSIVWRRLVAKPNFI